MKQNWQWTVVFITGFRLFMQAILLEREAYSACWLSPLIGFLIGLPFIAFTAKHWTRQGCCALPADIRGNVLRASALGYLLIDTAQMVLLYQEGTKFASLSQYPNAVLYLLLLLFSLFVIRQNRNGVFGIGAALKTALIICIGMLIVFRIPHMRIARLTPVLGGGTAALLRAGLSLAGYAFCFLFYLTYAPDIAPRTGTIIGMWATACGAAMLLTGMETMISPVAPGEPAGLYLAVSRLLASGRAQTSLQLVLYLAWFALLFLSVCLNLKCMSAAASDMLSRKENWPIQLAVLIAVTAVAIVSEHMMGRSLNAFLDHPGMYRSLLLLPLLLLPVGYERQVIR